MSRAEPNGRRCLGRGPQSVHKDIGSTSHVDCVYDALQGPFTRNLVAAFINCDVAFRGAGDPLNLGSAKTRPYSVAAQGSPVHPGMFSANRYQVSVTFSDAH
jgi:hypothetical protein